MKNEKESRLTMRDVAVAAGVSQPTVSRALRNDPALNAATAKRVREIAQRMGYRPNPLISTLMAQRRNRQAEETRANLAIVSTLPQEEESPTTRGHIEGAMERADSLGFSSEVFPLALHQRRGEDFFDRVFRARGILGVLVLPESLGDNPPLLLGWENYAVALIGYGRSREAFNRACASHYQDAYKAVSQVYAAGYRRIGFALDESLNNHIQGRWFAAYLAFLNLIQDSSVEPLPPCFWKERPARIIRDWIQTVKPEAIISCGHEIVEVIGSMREKPALAHLDAGDLPSNIAGICQDWRGVGRAGIDLVISQIHRNEFGLPQNPSVTVIRGEWRDGSSLPIKI